MKYGKRDRLKVAYCAACLRWEVLGQEGSPDSVVLSQHDTWEQAWRSANRRAGVR